MARTIGSKGEKTRQAINDAGLNLFYRHGYDGTSLRDLAAAVGLQQGSLYNHIESKQQLLLDLVTTHLSDLLAELDSALGDIADPVERLRAFIAFHLRYHASRRREVFICYSELRSLERANYKKVVAMRRRYEDVLTHILEGGIAAGVFRTDDARVAAFALLAMLSGILVWFREDGRKSIEEIATIYAALAFSGLGHLPSPRQSRSAKSAAPAPRPRKLRER